MPGINDMIPEVLREYPSGLTKEQLVTVLSEKTGREISPNSLKFTDLFAEGKIRRESRAVEVVRTEHVHVYLPVSHHAHHAAAKGEDDAASESVPA